MTNTLFHLFHMKQRGDKIFYVTPGLSSRLAQTSIDIDSYFLKSPYREIFVQIEPGLFFIRDGNEKVPVTGFYVYLRDLEDRKQIRIMAASLRHPTPERPLNESVFYFRLEFLPGKIHDQLTRYMEDEVKKDPSLDILGSGKNIEFLEDFAYFVFNTLLYINSKGSTFTQFHPPDFEKRLMGLKSTAKKNKTKQRAARCTSHKIIIIGDDVHKDLKEIQNAGGVGAWKLSKKVRVSGHWKVQWYGSEKDNSKHAETIWIEDYTKGPEFKEVIDTKFIVK